MSKSQVRQGITRLVTVPAKERSKLRGVRPARAWQILGGAVVAYETMRCLGIEVADVSPWALREGIMLEHLSSLLPDEPLTLQPLKFLESGISAPSVRALPDRQVEGTA